MKRFSMRNPTLTLFFVFLLGFFAIILYPKYSTLISYCCCGALLAFFAVYLLVLLLTGKLK